MSVQPIDEASSWEYICSIEDEFLVGGETFRNGKLWFCGTRRKTIYQWAQGRVDKVFTLPGEQGILNGIVFIDDNTMVAADAQRGLCLYHLDTQVYETVCDSYHGRPFMGLNDVLFDGEGLYFSDPGSTNYLARHGRVYYVKLGDWQNVELIANRLAYPNGLALDKIRNVLYVAEFNCNSVICIPLTSDPETILLPYVFARLEGGLGPDGMVVDDNQNLICAHFGAKEIVVVDRRGRIIQTVEMPEEASDFPTNVCIADGYLYVSTSEAPEIWRIRMATA